METMKLTPIELAVGILATARITRLVTEDSITEPIRDWAMRYPKLHELLTCPRCTSVWAGAFVVATSRVAPGLPRMLALSEGAILIQENS